MVRSSGVLPHRGVSDDKTYLRGGGTLASAEKRKVSSLLCRDTSFCGQGVFYEKLQNTARGGRPREEKGTEALMKEYLKSAEDVIAEQESSRASADGHFRNLLLVGDGHQEARAFDGVFLREGVDLVLDGKSRGFNGMERLDGFRESHDVMIAGLVFGEIEPFVQRLAFFFKTVENGRCLLADVVLLQRQI